MTYALQSDLALSIPPETLLRLSADDPMATAPDAGVVAEMLAAASAEIDAALSDGGLPLPDPVPPVIKTCAWPRRVAGCMPGGRRAWICPRRCAVSAMRPGRCWPPSRRARCAGGDGAGRQSEGGGARTGLCWR